MKVYFTEFLKARQAAHGMQQALLALAATSITDSNRSGDNHVAGS